MQYTKIQYNRIGMTNSSHSRQLYTNDRAHLLGEVVVKIGDDLDSHISLASTRRSHHQSQARLHATPNGLHLGGSERDSIP